MCVAHVVQELDFIRVFPEFLPLPNKYKVFLHFFPEAVGHYILNLMLSMRPPDLVFSVT